MQRRGLSQDELETYLREACDEVSFEATSIPANAEQAGRICIRATRLFWGVILLAIALPMLLAATVFLVSTECQWPEWILIEQAHQNANDVKEWGDGKVVCQTFLQGLGLIGPSRLDALFKMLSPSGRWKREHCFPGLYVPESVADTFRPPVPCDYCVNVTAVPELERGITHDEFVEKYAFTSHPVLIRGGVEHWDAVKTFSFPFFQALYNDVIGKDHIQDAMDTCNFFKYQSGYDTLGAALNQSYQEAMSGKRSWYVGWANCRDRTVKEVFRRLYTKPEFLPPDSLESHTDWVFMGLPGPGAEMHHDAILEPSWQAQVQGTKRWNLQPAPECADVCASFQVEVRSGDIIVVDTHRWFHQTTVLGDEMSITIGSEYQTPDGGIDTWDERPPQPEE